MKHITEFAPDLQKATLDQSRYQAKFLTSAKFLTYYCLSVILLLRVEE